MNEVLNDVQLETVDDSSFNNALSAMMEYPCVLMEGITSSEELSFFQKRRVRSEISLPFYGKFEGLVFKVGEFELSLDSLLTIRSIYPYKLTLLKNENDAVPIDIDDPNTLIKFIHL